MAVLSEEQSMLRNAARGWARERSPVSALRKLRDSGSALGYDPALWTEMAELGWAGVVVPEAYGGSNFGYLSMGLILEELGRTLTASPLLSTALAAASALTLGGSEGQKREWLPKIASGQVVAALAIDEGPHHRPETVGLQVSDAGLLNGDKLFVPEGAGADLLLVAARGPQGVSLYLVRGDAAGLERRPLAAIDSRAVADITFKDTPAERLADGPSDLVDQVLDRARAGLCAEMLGAALEAFEVTLDYLKVRVQFGQIIGSFQALQHRAAKMFTELELSRSAVEAALAAIDAGSPQVAELVSLAKVKMGETLFLVSNELIQMLGGIGMTDEHDAGFYLKRARVLEAALGNRAYHRARYLRLMGY